MIRRRCLVRGHHWSTWGSTGIGMPLQFCSRWFCAGERVSPWVPEPLATLLTEQIPEKDRG